MKRALLTVVVLAVALAGACGKSGPRPGEAVLKVDGGSTALVADAETPTAFTEVDGSPTLRTGDRVKIVSGSAQLTAADGVEYRLREKDTELVVGRRPVLVSGQALLVSTNDPAAIEAGDTRIEIARGALRVTRDLAVHVGTYEGVARVDSAGRVLQVPALREASIALAGEVPGSPKPLRYRDEDAWDRRFLAIAMSLTTELDARSRGITTQLPPDSDRVAVITRALPALEKVADLSVVTGREPGEAIVGGAIAIEGRGGDLSSRVGSVFSFRDQGATWGLVALDQRLQDAATLVEALDVALRLAPSSLSLASAPAPGAAPRATPGVALASSPTTARNGSPSQNGPTTTQPDPTTTTSPLPIPMPTTPPPPGSGPDSTTPDPGDPSQTSPDPTLFDAVLDLLGS